MSTARQRQLGSWLEKLRKQSGHDVEQAAEVLGCSVSKIRHMEAGRSKAKKSELTKLLDLYGTPDNVRAQLEATRAESEKRGWWESYQVPEWFAPFVEFESFASEAYNFELDLIPGLLQTERYAYEVHRTGRYTTNPPDITRRVEARMARQRRLEETPPLQFRAVVAESAFHRLVGGPEVMRAQIDAVIERCQLPNVILQVLPFEAGMHASPSGAFIVLSYSRPDEEPLGFMDSPLGGHTVDKAEDVVALRYVFDELRSLALPAPATLDRLRTIRDTLDGK
ncbi:helix-turn-helix domain-containing protein [Saccharopolyspora phatthalungensis]|uniref:Transcriptional regulator with XRE-family HTH domain n=1 Tax=Saccharopolyspora phatthalungensis TaxID=664693 RepID=A0A840PWA5_9PSEU|nr:helix-turn-helix transcriptional regulator [Saccharopolyspora phatthalungensis]MBB5152606.1 transcriptional regulator with XRE-family HTH domain [Saccharopolyspora phatthalungensis]